MDTGHWILNEGVSVNDETFGFIYEIINLKTNKKYIGKKQCYKRLKRKPLKGKTRNRISMIESSWKEYTSSSKELNEDIEKYGKNNFQFKILKTCNSKWELAYEEIKEQIHKNVLLRDDYYNGIINVRIGTPPSQIKSQFEQL
jgi:hypothetical protein